MHIVVVGCGRVGASLAHELTSGGHTVGVIDRRTDAFRRLGADFTGVMVEGVGFDRDRLIDAGVEKAAAVAAVTNGDNSNILVARVAREHFGVERVVARIYSPRRAEIYQRLGIPTVPTVTWTTDQVLRRLMPEARTPEWTDPTGKVNIVDRTLGDAWAGQLLSDVESSVGARVVAVNRMGAATLPINRMVAQVGDVVYFAIEADQLSELDAALETSAGKES